MRSGDDKGRDNFQEADQWELPDGLVVRILGIHCHGRGSVPGWGASHVAQPKQRKKKRSQWGLRGGPMARQFRVTEESHWWEEGCDHIQYLPA